MFTIPFHTTLFQQMAVVPLPVQQRMLGMKQTTSAVAKRTGVEEVVFNLWVDFTVLKTVYFVFTLKYTINHR
jgi:hypothetical protein